MRQLGEKRISILHFCLIFSISNKNKKAKDPQAEKTLQGKGGGDKLMQWKLSGCLSLQTPGQFVISPQRKRSLPPDY